MDQNDVTNLPRNVQIMLGVGLLAFIATFFPFDGIHEHGLGADENAWNGVAGVLGALAIMLGFVVVVGQTFAAANMPKLGVSWSFITTALGAFATLMFVIHWIALPSETVFGVHFGLSLQWGGYIEIILCIVFTAVAVMMLRESGEAMPWDSQGAAAPPAA
ncbi:MAG TPA: hypothetical protein VH274_07915 [Mycobacteriales bacterium]|nr:hypothetical protein [Mycobacteriales bacterium]